MASTPSSAYATQFREARRRAEALQRLTRPQALAAAGTFEGYEYLSRVVDEHAHLDRAGAVRLNPTSRLLLEEVFVPLAGVEVRGVDDRVGSALDWSLQDLEVQLRAGRISPLELEVEVEQLYERLLHGARSPVGGPAQARALGGVVADNSHVVILGEPGSGKTTLLRWLAQRHASERLLAGSEMARPPAAAVAPPWSTPALFPIYVRVGSLVALHDWRRRSLGDALIEVHAGRRYPGRGPLAELLGRELSRGSCLVMFDGMDEVRSAGDRRDIADLIRLFSDRWSPAGNRLVVTSRPGGYWTAPLPSFVHYQASEPDRDQSAELVERYCLALEAVEQPVMGVEHFVPVARQRAASIVSALDRNRGIAKLAATPFLLTLLILVQRHEAEIPDQRAAVYDSAARALEAGSWVGHGVGSDRPDRKRLRRFLVRLAGWVQEYRPAGVVDIDDVLAAFGDVWASWPKPNLLGGGEWPVRLRSDVERIIVGVCRHNGLLVERGPGQWSFSHQAFLDLYLAHGLLDELAPAPAIRSKLHDPRYTEPILLALGLASDVSRRPDAAEIFDAAILATGPGAAARPDRFKPSELEELIGRDRDFAVQAAVDDVAISSTTLRWLAASSIPNHLLAPLAGTPLGRLHAAYRLRQAADPLADDGVRWSGASALGQLGEAGAAAELLRTLVGDPETDDELRRRSTMSLGQLGETSHETLKVLRAQVGGPHVQSDLRWRSAVALGQLGDTGSETMDLLGTLAADASVDADVRWGCASALGRLGDSGTAAMLLGALAGDAGIDGYVRWSSIASLWRVGEPSTETLALLRALAGDPGTDGDVRWSSAAALGHLGDASAETLVLLRALAGDPGTDSDLRWSSAEALARLGDTGAAVRFLRVLAGDPGIDGEVRWSSAEALARLGDTSAAAELLRALAADAGISGYVRWRSAEALGRVGNVVASAYLLRSLVRDAEVDGDVRRRSATSLGRLGDTGTETFELLSAVAADHRTGGYLRLSSAVALGQLGDPASAAGFLRALAADPGAGSHVRRRSAVLLGQLGDTSNATVTLLRALVADTGNDLDLRRDCADALSRIGALTPPQRTYG